MTLMQIRVGCAAGRRAIGYTALAWLLTMGAWAQGVTTTTVQGTVYLANGRPGAGTLVVKWPAFTTAAGQAIAADTITVQIPADGFLSLNLAPNVGATPAGEFYSAIFYMSDGSSHTEYWVIPLAPQATLAQVRAQVMPAAQAVQAVSKAYVDQSIAQLNSNMLTATGGNMNGPLYLNGDPSQALQAATKHYVDTQMAASLPLAGGVMTGGLSTPGVNGVQAPAAGSAQTTLQAAVNAAGSNGAVEIPPGYSGTDTFTNPNGVRVTDLRTGNAQQTERSVKEFGAVCDGATDDTFALQSAINYANARNVALQLPEGTCKTRALNWRGESIGGMGKQVSALLGFPGEDVLASAPDSASVLSNTRLHDFTIYVDQSVDVSCSAAAGRAAAGSCQVSRPIEKNSILSPGGNGLTGALGNAAAWSVGNCAIAMPASTGLGGNGLKNAEIENLAIAVTGTDPLAAQYPGAHSTHTCGMYLAQWPQWSEFRNIDMRGVNTGVAIPALPVTVPAGLSADANRWQNLTIQAAHAFVAAAGSNDVLDNVVALAANSSATAEPPTGLVLDLPAGQQGWTIRNAVVTPTWNAVQPALMVVTASGAVTGVSSGSEHGLGWDPYGVTLPVAFSGSCTAQGTAAVNSDGSIGTVTVTQGGVGCSTTTTANINAAGTWDTAAPVNVISGRNFNFFGGNLLKGNGGYTVWKATNSASYGTQLEGGGGTLPGGGSYPALSGNAAMGTSLAVDQFPGADFGGQLQACVQAVNPTYGGTCDARNYSGNQSMGANVTIATGNTTVLLPCATISTANQIVIPAGTRNVALRGCALRGGSAASGSAGGTVFAYSGTGAMVQVGDPTYAVDTPGFHMDNAVINTTGATSASAQAFAAYRTQELDLESLYLLGNSNQTGMTLDGTGNYTGGTFLDDQISGFQTAVNAFGHTVANPATTDWLNASTFVRLHINCPTANGNPIAGTYGINLQQGDGNTFTGGDVEGCATALHLGANAQNNTIIGLRNENSSQQVVADAGSSYNNWITGGTMFTGQLTDNGTRNSFLDTFHRSFNGLNGDWYGSQQDSTLTNHYRLGIGAGNERGLLDRYQTDSGYRWTTGLSDATAGEQFYQVLDELNHVYRISIGQYNNGQSSTNNQTVINSAGSGAVVLNGSNGSGTGGVVFGSGGPAEATVATVDQSGNAQFNGALQVGGTSQSTGTMTVRNNADAEVDYFLWPGLSSSQKGSFTYKDWNGASQWYMVKDGSNNWALNSAVGGLDSFKAYQSTNSGDTYINASNASGVVRVNYENGAGTGFKIYGGNSGTLYASFTGSGSIAFPGLAAGSGHSCLQIDNSGYVTNTGTACGSGTGNVASSTAGYIAYYIGSGTAIGGVNTVPLTAGGTGSATAAGALANLGALSLAGGTLTGAVAGTNATWTGAETTMGLATWCSLATCPELDTADNAQGANSGYTGANFAYKAFTAAANQSGYQGFSTNHFHIDANQGGAYNFQTAVASGTYTSGGTISGSSGQTCNLAFAGGTGGTATVSLTGTNTIAGGSLLNITSGGYGYFGVAPTIAQLSNGSASCSGYAMVTTALSASGVKTDYIALLETEAMRTIGQHWGTQGNLACYAGGDCIGQAGSVTQYGGYLAPGDEQSEGLRSQVNQGTALFTASVSSIAGNTVNYTGASNSYSLGEQRLLIDTATAYTAGTLTAVGSSNPPVFTGTGTAWTAQFPVNTTVALCLDWLANGSTKFCLPGLINSDTSVTITPFAFRATQSGSTWVWGTGTGAYHMYRASTVTQVGQPIGASGSLTVADGTRFSGASQLEEELAYNPSLLGIQVVLNQTVGVPNMGAPGAAGAQGGGIFISDGSPSGGPGFSYGLTLSGNFQRAIAINGSGSKIPYNGIEFDVDPNGGFLLDDRAPASSNTLNIMRYLNSSGTARVIQYSRSADQLNFPGGFYVNSGTGTVGGSGWNITSGGVMTATNYGNVSGSYGQFGPSNTLADQTQVRAIGHSGGYTPGISLTYDNANPHDAIIMDGGGNLLMETCNSSSCSPAANGLRLLASGGFQGAQITPASGTATCTAGQFEIDAGYLHACTAANTWNSVPLGQFKGLPSVGWKVYSGTGSPADTCSSTANPGAIEINATPIAYQCSNATGSYAWNQLAGVTTAENVVAFSAAPTFSSTAALNTIILSGNVTSSTLSAGAAGFRTKLLICQDSSGSHTFAWPGNVRGGMTIGSTASKCSSQTFTYSANQSAWLADSPGITNE